ncbi:T9SS type A sorting domain-containing protein [Chryseobacterium nematophagum]|nr:T9SS type A sorting domain-containing protein [Chryseobacterium nematophagum]
MKKRKFLICVCVLFIIFFNSIKSQIIDKQFLLTNNLTDKDNTVTLVPVAYNTEYLESKFMDDIINPCSFNRGVYYVADNAGLKFNAGPGSSYHDYSVSLYFKFNPYQNGWARIIDVTDNMVDKGIYRLGNNLNFYPNGDVGSNLLINSGTEYVLLTLTRNGTTGLVKVYINGSMASTYNDVAEAYKLTSSGNFIFIKDDVSVTHEQSPTNLAYIRVTNTLLSDQDVLNMYNNICGSILGTEEVSNSDDGFKIYPNPVKDILKFKLSNSLYAESIKVYDMSGRLLTSIRNSNNVHEVDISDYSSGNYILKIKANNGKTYVQKICKK